MASVLLHSSCAKLLADTAGSQHSRRKQERSGWKTAPKDTGATGTNRTRPMTPQAKQPRYVVRDTEEGLGPCMILTAPWDSSLLGALRENGIQVLRLSDQGGWPPTSPVFLADLPIRGVEIYSDKRLDLTVIENMGGLELLGLECETKTPLDLSRLEALRVALVTWPQNGIAHLLDRPRLVHLNVSRYPYEDLGPINATKLKRLQLTSRKLCSLDGASDLLDLHTLDLLDCFRLVSIEGLRGANRVRVLALDCCKKVRTLDPLHYLPNLERLILENCGEIESLRPLQGCKNLTTWYWVGTRA